MDAQRGAVFTKMSREIIIAAKLGGADPTGNFRLRQAIDKAKAAGVPHDNIKRAIAKGAGADNSDQFDEVRYEGYGPSGVAVLVRALTDNRNRTAADLRAAFSKHGGNMGEIGCVGWMFAEKGQVLLSREDNPTLSEDDLMLIALEAGAEDIRTDEGGFEILCAPADLEGLLDALARTGLTVAQSGVADLPSNTQRIEDPEVARKLLKMLDKIEELDDVQTVSSNHEIPDALLADLQAV